MNTSDPPLLAIPGLKVWVHTDDGRGDHYVGVAPAEVSLDALKRSLPTSFQLKITPFLRIERGREGGIGWHIIGQQMPYYEFSLDGCALDEKASRHPDKIAFRTSQKDLVIISRDALDDAIISALIRESRFAPPPS